MRWIEVSDTTLAYDRDVKMPLYARAGIPESWIVDRTGQRILVFRQPEPDGYRETLTFERGASLSPLAFPHLVLMVDDILR